ncbi:hypothetical protein OG440_39605 (plasmid) [Streptomyces sp. NBC_00637]|uniref:hypothetical protein n=1 Tax=Streptomyces sp. NBC_00637 TaxID=2903667 RepID=UPI003253179C
MGVVDSTAVLAHASSAHGSVIAGVVLVTAATLAGAWLSRRRSGQQAAWLAAAAGALLVISGVHLLPDAWSDAPAAGIPRWAVPTIALASFALAGLVARKGCPCDPEKAGGLGTAAALTVHRFLEGSALALTSTLTVAGALAVHALAEGLAVGALLHAQPRRHLIVWLSAMCLGPVAGAAAVGLLPAAAETALVALAAGVLAQAAWVSLKAAVHLSPGGRRLGRRPAAVGLAAAAVTALAALVSG